MTDYDVIVVGAGINGCSLAHALHHKGQKVLVLEKDSVASGGSGAAGAFINPKISKSGPLKDLIETAYLYSIDFYQKNFPDLTTLAPLLHIAKRQDENEKVECFKQSTNLAIQEIPAKIKNLLTEYAQSFSSVCLSHNAILEAKAICSAMLDGIDFHQMMVETPLYSDGLWNIGAFKGKKLIVCTGAYDEIFKEEPIKLRRIYGQRCEVKSTVQLDVTVHHEVSVSATKKNGHIAIGASHYLELKELPTPEQGAADLIALARKSLCLEDIEVMNTFSGMRSGSNDYLPILGELVNTKESIRLDERALKGDRSALLSIYPQLYMVNGVGGYGFVLGPYLANLMCAYLIDEKPLPEFLQAKRFYYRWAKKEGQR